ncbi:MAG: hypothetical protein A2Z83_05180 [Omnitrophica bacterium GWA2_52_8]|nr:MAG: hypothetical protein A2Z83_05180 [Omnitrophica bacterium GWA2_52_8]
MSINMAAAISPERLNNTGIHPNVSQYPQPAKAHLPATQWKFNGGISEPIFLLSGHMSVQDGEWVGQKIEASTVKLSKNTPIHIWLERAQTEGLPQNIRELEIHYGRLSDGSGSWHEKIMTTDTKTTLFLRQIHATVTRAAQPLEATGVIEAQSDSFLSPIAAQINALRQMGYDIQVHWEMPSFEAWILFLKQNAMTLAAIKLLAQGDVRTAVKALETAYALGLESMRVRDNILAKSWKHSAAKSPNAMHIVQRGIAHTGTLQQSFDAHSGMPKIHMQPAHYYGSTQAHILSKRLFLYISKHHSMPDSRSAEGTIFIVQQLMEAVLRASASGRTATDRELIERISKLPDKKLNDWIERASRAKPASLRHLGIDTRQWLSDNQSQPKTFYGTNFLIWSANFFNSLSEATRAFMKFKSAIASIGTK